MCIINGQQQGLLIGRMIIITNKSFHTQASLDQATIEWPQTHIGSLTIPPSTDDGRFGFVVSNQTDTYPTPEMVCIVLPRLACE